MKYKPESYWLTTGEYTKEQLTKIASTIVQFTPFYDSYDIVYRKAHGKMRGQIIFQKGPHREYKCHPVIIKKRKK